MEKPETGDIKKSLFTLLFSYLTLAEDINLSDLIHETKIQDGEDDSDPGLIYESRIQDGEDDSHQGLIHETRIQDGEDDSDPGLKELESK